ncbi:hypothetical protein HDV62DRAFT_59273 [Trichoderma sp. SZMC 28011]
MTTHPNSTIAAEVFEIAAQTVFGCLSHEPLHQAQIRCSLGKENGYPPGQDRFADAIGGFVSADALKIVLNPTWTDGSANSFRRVNHSLIILTVNNDSHGISMAESTWQVTYPLLLLRRYHCCYCQGIRIEQHPSRVPARG